MGRHLPMWALLGRWMGGRTRTTLEATIDAYFTGRGRARGGALLHAFGGLTAAVVPRGGLDLSMAGELLNGAQVGTSIQ